MKHILALISLVCFWVELAAQLVVSGFAPTSGNVGATVTITGSNFSAVLNQNIVFFGAVRATVTNANANVLQVSVPAGATYHPITVTVNGRTAYSASPFVVTFPGGTGSIDANTFASQVSPPLADEPRFLLFHDLDGDGKGDLISPSVDSDIISIYRNTSIANSISFAPKLDFSTNDEPREIVAADFDGDGRSDLAVVNSRSNNVSVFRNTSTTGNITFAPKVDLSCGFDPRNLAVRDLNNDGRPDIVTSNSDFDNVVLIDNI